MSRGPPNQLLPPPVFEVGESDQLPIGLVIGILERVQLPVVISRDADAIHLNAAARALWPNSTAVDSLRIVIDGKESTLPDRLAELNTGSLITVPGSGQFQVFTFHWARSGASPWIASILRSPGAAEPERELLDNKLTRLKAIVHEMRNTLTAAREALSFLQEGIVGELNADQRRFLSSAVEDVDGLGRAMVELTSLWITQAGVLRLMPRTVDIRQVVEQTTLSAKPVAEKRGISLCVEFGDRPALMTGDHGLLVQALRNVVTNALRHTPDGGTIRVRTYVRGAGEKRPLNAAFDSPEDVTKAANTGKSIVIEVRDSGPGIQLTDQERIFQPFERVQTDGSSNEPVGGGMGLGLSIAREIASGHGGTLRLRAASGMGSCFVFEFPESGSCSRAWMLRAVRQAMEEVRPLRGRVACVLLRFERDPSEPQDAIHADTLSIVQQAAIKHLRPSDTVLTIDEQLLVLLKGGTTAAASAMINRVLHLLVVEKVRADRLMFQGYRLSYGLATYPEDGESAEAILGCAEAGLRSFS